MRGGVLQLHRWGLLDRVAATGAPPVRRVTFHYGHDSMPVTLKPYAGVDALYAPRRTVLDALLVGAAEEAGARFGFGLVDDRRGSRSRRAGRSVSSCVTTSARPRTERAGLLVGADGRSSLVARQVGAPTVVAGSHAAAYVYGYWPAADLDGYHWYYGDGLSAGVIPTNDGLACVFAAGPAAVLAARMRHSRPLDAARELLARLDCRLTDLTRVRAAGPGPILPRPASPIATPLWTGLGAGRGCRVVEGSAVHLRNHRRVPRRRVAGPGRRRGCRVGLRDADRPLPLPGRT